MGPRFESVKVHQRYSGVSADTPEEPQSRSSLFTLRRDPAKRSRRKRRKNGAARALARRHSLEAGASGAKFLPTPRPVGQVVKTAASHAVNIGSNPVRVTTQKSLFASMLRGRFSLDNGGKARYNAFVAGAAQLQYSWC